MLLTNYQAQIECISNYYTCIKMLSRGQKIIELALKEVMDKPGKYKKLKED